MGSRAVGWVVVAAGAWLVLGAAAGASETEAVYSYGESFHLRIPADPAADKGCMQTAVVDVPDHLTIEDLDVSVDISHDSAFDLELYVESPAGTAVLLNKNDLVDGFYEGADYRSTVFDDEASMSIGSARPPFDGRYRPLSSLAAFDGEDARGPWRLHVCDVGYADTGYLHSVTLTITAPEPATAALLLLGLGLLRRSRHGCRLGGGTHAS